MNMSFLTRKKKSPDPLVTAMTDVTDEAAQTRENPYTAGRREWMERYGSFIFQRNLAIGFSGAVLVIAAIAVGGVVYIGSQSKIIPYIVGMGKLGETVAVGPAEKATSPSDRAKIIKASLASWIADVREITPDTVVKLKAIRRAYGMLETGEPANVKLDQWFAGNPKVKNNYDESSADPMKRAAKETVEVQLQPPIPLSAETWQVDWVEIVRDRKGIETDRFSMRAVLTTYDVPSTTEEQILKNPGGVYLRDFTWTKQF